MKKRQRDQWRKKPRRKSRKMPEGVKAELAQKKAEGKRTEDDLYRERFERSLKLTAQHLGKARGRTRALREGYFKRVYGNVWREVMEGVRAQAEGEV